MEVQVGNSERLITSDGNVEKREYCARFPEVTSVHDTNRTDEHELRERESDDDTEDYNVQERELLEPDDDINEDNVNDQHMHESGSCESDGNTLDPPGTYFEFV